MNPQSGGLGLPHHSHKLLYTDIVLLIALVGTMIFAAAAYSGEQKANSNSTKKIDKAVAAARNDEDTKVAQQFNDRIEQPYKDFAGPTTYGSVNFNYPKSYSAYVDETSTSEPINGWFYPDIVPGLSSNTAFALRVELLTSHYSQNLDSYSGSVKKGILSATAYTPPRMVGINGVQVGTRLDGMIGNKQTGSVVLIPIRDKTLKIYTESTGYLDDFNNVILPSLTFVP